LGNRTATRRHHLATSFTSALVASAAFLLLSSQQRWLQPASVDRVSIWARLQYEWTLIKYSTCHFQ
jgi:hypothetical protein